MIRQHALAIAGQVDGAVRKLLPGSCSRQVQIIPALALSQFVQDLAIVIVGPARIEKIIPDIAVLAIGRDLSDLACP